MIFFNDSPFDIILIKLGQKVNVNCTQNRPATSAQDPFNFNADPDADAYAKKMDSDPRYFFKIY